MPDQGRLQVQVYQGQSYKPIDNAKVTITQLPEASNKVAEQKVVSNNSGQTSIVELLAPSKDNSMKPSDKAPYSLCDVKVEAEGYRPLLIKGCQIYPDTKAIQQCNMNPIGRDGYREEVIIDVAPNRLVGNYPPKIPEAPEKPLPKPVGTVVLPQPVVPEFVIVHTGMPDDPSAPNFTMRYKDYITNVGCSEIFSTWPENTIRANLLCIISFTLNRIYTEWYRAKGKNFNITNSTAYDHAFSYGRTIYDSIANAVDSIFSTYMLRPNAKQPLLAQYCDGVKVQCPNWLTQWGSKYQGDLGKSPYEILTYFYGTDLNLTTAKKVSGIPSSYPGYTLGMGSSGRPVRDVQTYLNRISQNYPAIPKQRVDGYYGQATRKSVLEFQKVFSMPITGTVDYATWYKISDIYVGVTKIAELRGTFVPPVPYGEMYDFTPTVKYPLED